MRKLGGLARNYGLKAEIQNPNEHGIKDERKVFLINIIPKIGSLSALSLNTSLSCMSITSHDILKTTMERWCCEWSIDLLKCCRINCFVTHNKNIFSS